MDFNPFTSSSNFVDLLRSQQQNVVFGSISDSVSLSSSQLPFFAKNDGSSKKRKCGDVSHSASSKATEADSVDDDEATNRPKGVNAAKASSKKAMADGKELSEFQTMWSFKKEDLALKERLSKMKLLDSLIAKQGPLPYYEEALKKKLIDELMSI
ncbi:hypothetical protein Bca52824_080811 [Brassica carinata]|uniref:No apical meristem-associated C-terminal domain-containing protein n=1 Tax=Brassica carinata TaxID=52824 RepID=A0A8X7PG77_BRACI|nr:hypothetical protein Bca52824_080811 [Brassica carinata]